MKSILLFFCLSLATMAQAQWNAFGTGFGTNDFVIGFTEFNGALLANTYPSPFVMEWDGSATWNANLPSVPSSGGIHRLLVVDTTLYAATYSANTFHHFYKLVGNAWEPMGGEFRNWGSTAYPSIYDIAVYHDTLYIAGEFARCGTDTINYVARWADTAWVALGEGLSGALPPFNGIKYPHALVVYNDELVVAGNFRYADGLPVNGIAAWNGSNWHGFGDGFNKSAYGLCVHNGQLYAGGEFTTADSLPVKCLARWNGTSWEDPGLGVSNVGLPGVTPYIHSLLSHNGRLVVSGGFNRIHVGAGTQTGKGVCIWDGTLVDGMDGGVNGDVEALYPWQTGLLVGGNFTVAGGTVPANRVAYYDFITAATAARPTAWQVYPTVVQQHVHVRGEGGDAVRVSDMMGRTVLALPMADALSLGHLPQGPYVLQVLAQGTVVHSQRLLRVD